MTVLFAKHPTKKLELGFILPRSRDRKVTIEERTTNEVDWQIVHHFTPALGDVEAASLFVIDLLDFWL